MQLLNVVPGLCLNMSMDIMWRFRRQDAHWLSRIPDHILQTDQGLPLEVAIPRA